LIEQNWCERVRPEIEKKLIQVDTHCSGKYRTNIPLSNFETFSEVFIRKSGTKLNPKTKYVLWGSLYFPPIERIFLYDTT